MAQRYPIFCDAPELAVECSFLAQELGLEVDPEVVTSPLSAAVQAATRAPWVGIAVASAPSIEQVIGLRSALQAPTTLIALAVLGSEPGATAARSVASDIGVVTTREIAPLLSTLALLRAGATAPWVSSLRQLPTADRARLSGVIDTSQRPSGHLLKMEKRLLGWSSTGTDEPTLVGSAAHVADAIAALRDVSPSRQALHATLEGVDERAVLDVLFGPARALSDPASKAALAPYGLPMPLEELCSSASRAAAEAARFGFPVRIALASPDLRVWDSPDLVEDGVDNAARVRETFRLLTALAQSRAPQARILGVTVGATTEARAHLRAVLRPLPGGAVETTLGFADPHGIASDDSTTTVLPTSPGNMERVISRLRGQSIILGGGAAQRRLAVTDIADALLRAAAFVTAHAREVASVELRPITVLTGGGVEVREACVTINDAFEQTYQRASGLR